MLALNRPLAWILSAFLAGLFLCALFSFSFLIPLFAALFLAAMGIFLYFLGRNRRWGRLISAVLFLALGLSLAAPFCAFSFERYAEESARFDGVKACIEGTVTNVSRGEKSVSFTLTDVTLDGEMLHTNVRLTTYKRSFLSLSPYDRVSCFATLSSPKNTLYGFDTERYSFSQGISLVATFTDGLLEKTESLPLLGRAETLRSTLGEYLVLDSAPEVRALLLGDDALADEEFEEKMRVIGVSHIFSISGLHLTLLLSALYMILFRLRVPRIVNTFAVMGLALFYMVLTGFSPAVSRAGIMAILFYLAIMLRRESDPLTSLLFATAFLCAVDPFSVMHTGLQLSFLATLGIFTLGGRVAQNLLSRPLFAVSFPKKFRFLPWLKGAAKWVFRQSAELLIMNMSAIVITLPVLLTITNEISLVSPFANLLLVPLFSPILILSALYLLSRLCIGALVPIDVFFTYLSEIFGFLVDTLFAVFRGLVDFFANMDFAVIFVHYPFLPTVIVIFVILLFVAVTVPRLTRFYPLLPVLFVVIFLCSLGLHVLKNDGTVMYKITARADDKLIIDGEDGCLLLETYSLGSAPSSQTQNTLRQNGISEIDFYVLPTLDEKGVGRVLALLEDCAVKTVLVPEIKNAAKDRLARMLSEKGVSVLGYRYGEDIAVADTCLRIYPNTEKAVWYVWEGDDRRICYGRYFSDGTLLPEPETKYDFLFVSGKTPSAHPAFATAEYTALHSDFMGELYWLAAQKWFEERDVNLLDLAEHRILQVRFNEEIAVTG